MGNLISELFELLNNDSKVTNDKLDKSYEEFIEKVKQFYQSENDYLTIIRILNLTCIEFIALQILSQYEQGVKYVFITKTISFLDNELELINRYPSRN